MAKASQARVSCWRLRRRICPYVISTTRGTALPIADTAGKRFTAEYGIVVDSPGSVLRSSLRSITGRLLGTRLWAGQGIGVVNAEIKKN